MQQIPIPSQRKPVYMYTDSTWMPSVLIKSVIAERRVVIFNPSSKYLSSVKKNLKTGHLRIQNRDIKADECLMQHGIFTERGAFCHTILLY